MLARSPELFQLWLESIASRKQHTCLRMCNLMLERKHGALAVNRQKLHSVTGSSKKQRLLSPDTLSASEPPGNPCYGK